MPQYSLREYTSRITAQIQDGQIEEAIAHTRHILSHYPRYLPAYSLLARASMEKGDFSHASHFFQTILSANPEDANAWMNLAQLSDDLGEVEQAVWYMERAFEIEPGNSHIRDRLRQLYGERDGIERSRIKLTPAALARTQTRSGSFRRASQKLQRIIKTETKLPPLQIATLEVTLAKALWNQKGKASQADEVCGSLLQKFPRCFQANLLRAQIYASAGQSQEAAPYLDIARELDPEGEFGFKLLGPQSPLPQTRVEIPYLDYQPAQPEPKEPVQDIPQEANWLEELGHDEQPITEQAQENDATNDLEQEPLEPPIAPPQPAPALPEQPDTAADTELPVPAWLREIQQEGVPDTAQEDLDWLQEPEQEEQGEPMLQDAPHLPESEIPDWLEGLRPMRDEQEQEVSEPVPPEEQTMVGQVPDWLLDLGQEPDAEETELGALTALPADQEPEPEVPDWLQQLQQTDEDATVSPVKLERPEPLAEQEPVVGQEPSLAELDLSDDPNRPAWLQELQAEITGTPAAAPITQPLDRLAPAPDLPKEPVPSDTEQDTQEPYAWMSDLGITELPDQEPALEPALEEELPDQESALEPTPEEELPDWLLELRDQTGAETLAAEEPEPAEQEAEIEPEAQEVESEAALGPQVELAEPEPETVSILDASLELEDQDLEQELPEWLQSLETEPEPEAETESVGDLDAEQTPDWLSQPAEEPVSTVTVDQMPEWLGRLQGPEAKETDEPVQEEPVLEPATDEQDMEWLQELTSIPEQQAPVPELKVEPLVELTEPEPLPLPEAPVPVLDSAPDVAEPAVAPKITARLIRAPAPPDASILDASVQQYESIVARGDVKEELIAELEEAVQAHPEHSGLQRVLGDAYMQSDQLGQALEAYREALRKL